MPGFYKCYGDVINCMATWETYGWERLLKLLTVLYKDETIGGAIFMAAAYDLVVSFVGEEKDKDNLFKEIRNLWDHVVRDAWFEKDMISEIEAFRLL
ncbi:hypothetical protein COOONC_24353 [Cooperia oncophora]